MTDDLRKKITKLREDFLKGTLDEKDTPENPFELFRTWMKQALDEGIPEVQAMTLATCNAEGKPSARIVYLREFENHSFYFYGNYESRKGKELKENPRASLLFFWPQLERQIRLEGKVEMAPSKMADDYFNNRPYESKLGAWASRQSSLLENRRMLDEQMQAYREKFKNGDVPRPDWWGGWVLKADYYEFWQGRKSRLHDRICYKIIGQNQWEKFRIYP
jgi:pyridoxamine 5'-phosphate oxidase